MDAGANRNHVDTCLHSWLGWPYIPLGSKGKRPNLLYFKGITLHSPLLQNLAPRHTAGLGGIHFSWLMCVCARQLLPMGQCSGILWAPREENI